MSCGLCFECDNCVVYCPQTAVARVPKKEATTGRYVVHRLRQVHRLPHLHGRLPDRLHPDGARRVARCAATAHRRRIGRAVGALLALAAALAAAGRAAAEARRRACRSPTVAEARAGRRCVEDTAFMRRNHMELLKHQRDRTVHEGIRTTQHSLANCVDCHAEHEDGPRHRQQGRASARAATATPAVKLDCFECHADRREGRQRPRRRVTPPGAQARMSAASTSSAGASASVALPRASTAADGRSSPGARPSPASRSRPASRCSSSRRPPARRARVGARCAGAC